MRATLPFDTTRTTYAYDTSGRTRVIDPSIGRWNFPYDTGPRPQADEPIIVEEPKPNPGSSEGRP